MSRLGKQPLTLPTGVNATFIDGVLTMTGPKGSISRTFTDDVTITLTDGTFTFAPAHDTIYARALWGTYAAHVHNMVRGVTEGFSKVLEVEGVGFRVEMKGNTLVFALGFSHPVEWTIPEGIDVAIEKNVITITGVDKDAVGQFAAVIRASKKPEPYKGKGIRYQGEQILRKQGKRATA